MKGIRVIGAVAAFLLVLGTGIAWAGQGESGDTSPAPSGVGSVKPGPEVAADRTASSQTFRLSGDKLETRLYQSPVNYPARRGGWEPIGERLRSVGGETLANGASNVDISLPKQIDTNPARVSLDGGWVASELASIGAEPVQLEGETARYESPETGVTFNYTGLPTGLKEDIELTGPADPSTFSFTLSASAGLMPKLEEGGAVAFRDGRGDLVALLPPPVMSDSNGAESRAVHYELGPEREGNWRLTVRADRAWLTDQQRSFPAVIDPTITTGPPYGCVIGGHKGETGWIDCASWGRTTFLTGYTPKIKSSEDNWWRTLMNFETQSIPPTAEVSSATFHIRSTETAQNTEGVELRKVTKPWTWQASWSRYDGPEHLWETEGGDYSEWLGEVLTSERGSQAGWWEFSLPTETVEEEATEGEQLEVIMKLLDDQVRECGKTSCTNRQITFDSSAAKTEANRPYLSVVYTMPSSETPIAEYSFNEGSGETAEDGSGHGHDATLNGAKWSGEGHFGGALSFDGEAALATVPSSRELELSRNFTLEAWVKPEEIKEWGAILTKETPEFASYQLEAEAEYEYPAGFVFGSEEEEEAIVEGTSSLPSKAWSYLALTSDGEYLRLYVDGELVGTTATLQAAGGKGPLQIGGDLVWGEEDAFRGLIDNIRIYNRTLSGAEVEEDEAQPVGAKAPSATSEAATAVTASGATLKDTVNPNGTAATYQFEYGTTTSYGTKVPTSPESAGSGTSPVAVSKAIDGLEEATTYHFRVTATSEGGTSYGEDKTFTTLELPSAVTESAYPPSETEAVVSGKVNPNGLSTTYQYEYGTSTSYGSVAPAKPASAGAGTSPVEASELITGLKSATTYHFRLTATSSGGTATGSDKTFTTQNPPDTTITSPMNTYLSGEAPAPIEFTSDQPGSTFKCALDNQFLTKPCTSPYTAPAFTTHGEWHTVWVTATNSEQAADPTPAEYIFNTGIYKPAPSTSKLISPGEGAKSGSDLTLASEWDVPLEGGHVSSVAYQLKAPSSETFKQIPSLYLWNTEGEHPGWALEVANETKSPPLYFDLKAFAEAEGWEPVEEGVELRAVFNGGHLVAGASKPVNVSYSRFGGGPSDAVEQVGPASVDLVTGAFTIVRSDVSIAVPGTEANLEFTRTFNSAYGASEKTNSKTLGQMWQPAAPVEADYEEEAWQKALVFHEDRVEAVFEKECWNEEGNEVGCGPGNQPCDETHFCEEWEAEAEIPEQNWVEVLDNEGAGIPFNRTGSSAPYTYVPPEEAKEYTLSESGGNFILADPNGTKTEFTRNGTTNDYVPSKVSYAGTASQSRLTYEIFEKQERLEAEIGPAQAGVECNPLKGEGNYAPSTKGCRSLYFSYSEVGSDQRLHAITYYDSSGSGTGQAVAEYAYDSTTGNLTEEWDPRVTPEPRKETYTYESTNGARLASLTPPGLKPWQFAYYPAGSGGPYEAKLKSASHASLLIEGPSTATTTLAYDVAVTGEGAPYDLSLSAISKWGQSDYPVDATAVFPPTEVPAEEPSDYDQAVVHYLDPGGNEVNTAHPSPPGVEGDSIATSETDLQGNVVRELTAQNRLLALQAENPAERSHELDTHSEYSADGTEMLQSWGPLHEVRLESGEKVQARQHTTVEYDYGFKAKKEDETSPRLPTTETVTAFVPAKAADFDSHVTKTGYNWELRKPTEQITDPSGLNLVSTTAYNSAGQVTESRQPSDTEGEKAGTTKTVYWTAGTNSQDSSCGNNAAYAGLPCKTLPAAQPGTEGLPELPVTRYAKFNSLDEPEEVIDSPGGKEELGEEYSTIHKTITNYNSVGQETRSKLIGAGKFLWPTITVYDPQTGMPVEQKLDCWVSCKTFDNQAVAVAYDELGHPIQYTDADGSTSTTKYDLAGRPETVFDGKGTQTYGYDETSGALVALSDSAAGTFAAAYDAEGKLIEEGLPDGLVAKTTYDGSGEPTKRSYTKVVSCTGECTWVEESNERSIFGQILSQASLASSEEYTYDKAGRLEWAKETPTGKGCTTRQYSYDADSNRTKLTTRPSEGACETESTGTSQEYQYDAADRLTGPETVTYDSFGRITNLPAKFAGGSTLETSYYYNGMVASQSQGGLTNTYELDAAGRPRQVTQTGTKTGTELFHYAMASDSTAWTERGSSWSRNIGGIGGSLAAIQDSSGTTSLQLTNLHGDVVASASISVSAKEPTANFEFEEFGNPVKGSSGRYGWLGGKQRRTELPSGVIQMGVRSYIPTLGRFITSDPVPGGSANAYDYANQDPVNGFDLNGTCSTKKACVSARRRARAAVRRATGRIRARMRKMREKRARRSTTYIGPGGMKWFPWEKEVNKVLHKATDAVIGMYRKTCATIGGAIGAAGTAFAGVGRALIIGGEDEEKALGGALQGIADVLGLISTSIWVGSELGIC